MITVTNSNNEQLTFSKNSILKITSKDDLHTIYFIDGSVESFKMALKNFEDTFLIG